MTTASACRDQRRATWSRSRPRRRGRQRWRHGTHSWRQHIHEGGFDARRYSVEPVDEATARAWVRLHHYTSAYPAASQRYGLFGRDGQLVGAVVLGVPMSARALTNGFPDLEPLVETLELSRMVLADEIPGNAESWFLARVFEAAAERGLRGVVAFADPVPRHVAGRVLFAGHPGHVYAAANAAYLGRATARTLTVLPDGAVLSARSAQKVRAGERGHAHVERQLVQLGATPRRPHADRAAWLTDAVNEIGSATAATTATPSGSAAPPASARARVRLGMSPMPRPGGVDRPPPEQLALFTADRPTVITAMPGAGEDRP